MAEPYRAPQDRRPRWVETYWPRASTWPLVLALSLSLPCFILGWQGEREAQVIDCNPSAAPARRCSITSAEFPEHTRVESCEHAAMHSRFSHAFVIRTRTEPFRANELNVFAGGDPVAVAPRKLASEAPAQSDSIELLRSCAEGTSDQAVTLELHRRLLWLMATPLLALVTALRWMLGRRVRVILDADERFVRITRLGSKLSAQLPLDERARPGWIRVGDTDYQGELSNPTTRRQLTRLLADRVG